MTLATRSTSLTEVRLRQAAPTDLEGILALERETANAPHWPPATYAAIFDAPSESKPQRCLFVAERHTTIVGFASAVLRPAESSAELETVAVATSARRSGIGRALCLAVLDWCRERGSTSILLEVRATSATAIALYSSLGFSLEGRRPNYYREPTDDALILGLQLSRPA